MINTGLGLSWNFISPEDILVQNNYWDKIHTHEYTTPEKTQEEYQTWEDNIPNLYCSCKENYKELKVFYPIDFSSRQKYFYSLWDIHNQINKKLDKPFYPLADAIVKYNYPVWWEVSTNNTPTKPNLVITIATGEYKEQLAITSPLMKDYADRCNADFITLTNHTQGWWGLEKFRVKDIAKDYNKILYLDCDVLIKPHSPNLFEIARDNVIYMHSDVNEILKNTKTLDWYLSERKQLYLSQNISEPTDSYTAYNTGVVLFSGKDSNIWNPLLHPFPRNHCDEQLWVEYNCSNRPISCLNIKFNTQWWMKDFNTYKQNAYFIHYANAPDRINLMKKEIKSW